MKKLTFLVTITVLCLANVFAQAPEKFNYQAVVRNASNQLMSNASVGVRVSILQGSSSGSAVYVETQTVTTNANGLMTVEIGGGNAQQGAFANIDWANGPYFLKTETDPDGGSNYNVTTTQQLMSVPYALYAEEAGNSFSGDYNDLTNTPDIPIVPTNVSAFTNDAGYITMDSIPAIPIVPNAVSSFINDAGYLTSFTETDPQFNAWDKDYNDLINKPEIPNIPSDISAFNNDAGFITSDDIPEIPVVPENVSAFVNDVPYLTSFTEQQVLTISNDTLFLTGGSFVKLPEGFSGSWNDLTDKPILFDGNYNSLNNKPVIPEQLSVLVNDMNYISNIDTGCVNSINLCELLNQIEALSNQIFNLNVVTMGVTTVTQTSFTVNGEVTSDGGIPVVSRGFVYSTSHNPTIADLRKNVGLGMGTFTTSISGLTPGTTYYVRAFATNENTVKYGNEVSVTTTALSPSVIPIVNTTNVSDVSTNMAVVSGNVISDGGANITSRGFVYDTIPNPTLNHHNVQNVAGTGTFSNMLTSLSSGTTYHIRAYATNSVGTAYGNELTFTTLSAVAPIAVGDDGQPCPGTPTVTDHEGNVYNTVQIGTQCWTKENLRTTTSPSTGTYLLAPIGAVKTVTGKQARWFANDSTTYAPLNYGLLYNWNAAVDTFNTQFGEISLITPGQYSVIVNFIGNRRGICPLGWHIPSAEEFTTFKDYIESTEQYRFVCYNNYDPDPKISYGKSICAQTTWKGFGGNCWGLGTNPQFNNAAGFTAFAVTEDIFDFGEFTNFWSSTMYLANGNYRTLNITSQSINALGVGNRYLSAFLSVRCLKD